MAQVPLIYPDANNLPPFFLGLPGVPNWEDVLEIFEYYSNNENKDASWNAYAAALLHGMPFDFEQFKILTYSYDSEYSGLEVITWLARNIPLPDNHADFFWCNLPDYGHFSEMPHDVLIDAVDAFIKIGMTLTAQQIYRITPHCFEAKSVFLRRMYQLRVIDPTEYDVGLYLDHVNGKFEEDLLRVVFYDRQFKLPELLVYYHDQSFFENFLPQLYHDDIISVDPYDFRHYHKKPTMRMKLAMLTNNVDHAIDKLKFQDRVLKLRFKRMRQRAIALCDTLPVELAYKAAAKSGLKCLTGPRMLALMKKRQVEYSTVTVVE